MVNVITEAEKIGIVLTDEQKNALKQSIGEKLYSEAELNNKVKKAEAERDQFKTRAESAEETLKGFEGKDFDQITKERDEWKSKAEAADSEYKKKLSALEKEELLKKAFETVEFTSTSAKKAVMSEIAESVTVKDGKLIGFNDLLAEAKKNDASAFVDKTQQTQARFTDPNAGNRANGGNEPKTRESILSIKDRAERQKAIAENISLFQH